MIGAVIRTILYFVFIFWECYIYSTRGFESAGVSCFWFMAGYLFMDRVGDVLSALSQWGDKHPVDP